MKLLNLKEPEVEDLALKQEHHEFKPTSQTRVSMLSAQPTQSAWAYGKTLGN